MLIVGAAARHCQDSVRTQVNLIVKSLVELRTNSVKVAWEHSVAACVHRLPVHCRQIERKLDITDGFHHSLFRSNQPFACVHFHTFSEFLLHYCNVVKRQTKIVSSVYFQELRVPRPPDGCSSSTMGFAGFGSRDDMHPAPVTL
jgi:hypothetical protein